MTDDNKFEIRKLTYEELNLQRLRFELMRPLHIMGMAESNGRKGSMLAWRQGAHEAQLALQHYTVGYDPTQYTEAIDTIIPHGEVVLYTISNQLFSIDIDVQCSYRGKPYSPKAIKVERDFISVWLKRPLNGFRPIRVRMLRKA